MAYKLCKFTDYRIIIKYKQILKIESVYTIADGQGISDICNSNTL